MAKIATARKLLEWIYHILKDGRSFQEVENVVEAIDKGEPVNSSDKVSVFRDDGLLGHNRIDCLSVLRHSHCFYC